MTYPSPWRRRKGVSSKHYVVLFSYSIRAMPAAPR
jgi:hypothetical protein